MHIGIDVTNLPFDNRGMGRYVRSILQCFAASPRGHQFSFMSGLKAAEKVTQELKAIFNAEPHMIYPNSALCQVDAAWYPWNHIPPYPITQCVKILTIHDIYPCFIHDRKNCLKLQQGAQSADCVIADSEFIKTQIVSYFKLAPESIHVVPLGVSLSGGSPAEPLSPLPYSPYILFVGVMETRKNFEGLLQAFGLLKTKYRMEHHLIAIGDIPPVVKTYAGIITLSVRNTAIAKLIQRLDLSSWVHLPGMVGDAELEQYYTNAEVFVLPSFYEGFGLPVLEAMSRGVAVVTSTAASLPEVAGDAGWYCDPHNIEDLAATIAQCLHNTPQRLERIAKGLERARQFTWDACAQKILDILELHV